MTGNPTSDPVFTCARAAVAYAVGGQGAGGRARAVALVLSSEATGRHYTYRIRRAPAERKGSPAERRPWFVSVDDDSDRGLYIGLIADRQAVEAGGRRVPSPDDAPDPGQFFGKGGSTAVRAFGWAWCRLLAGAAQAAEAEAQGDPRPGPIPAGLEVRHDGRCCRCGRELTDPASVDLGIGPVCRARVGA